MQIALLPAELRRRRLGAFFTQEALAEKSKISVATIRKAETSTTDSPLAVRPSTVLKLAAALGCDPGDISQVLEVVA